MWIKENKVNIHVIYLLTFHTLHPKVPLKIKSDVLMWTVFVVKRWIPFANLQTSYNEWQLSHGFYADLQLILVIFSAYFLQLILVISAAICFHTIFIHICTYFFNALMWLISYSNIKAAISYWFRVIESPLTLTWLSNPFEVLNLT